MIGASINFAVVFAAGLLVMKLTSRDDRRVRHPDETVEEAWKTHRELVGIVTVGNYAFAALISSFFALAYASSFGHGDPVANLVFTVAGGASLAVMAVCRVLVRRHVRKYGKEG